MNITKHNYEAYLLDHLEGRLSDEESALLLSFLADHPELDADFDIDTSPLPVSDTTAPSFELSELRSENGETPEAVDLWLAKRLEGEQEALDTPINDPDTQKAWETMKRCKLKPEKMEFAGKEELQVPAIFSNREEWEAAVIEGDENGLLAKAYLEADPDGAAAFAEVRLQPETIAYPNKSELKREGKVVALRPVLYRSAVAAVILVLFTVGFYFLNNDPIVPAQSFAQSEPHLSINRGVAIPASNIEESVKDNGESTSVTEYVAYTSPTETSGTSPRSPHIERMERIAIRQAVANQMGATQPLELQIPDMNSVDALPQEYYAENASSIQQAVPWKEFVVNEAKKKVLGRPQAENETFFNAIAEKVNEKSDGQVAIAANPEEKEFYFRVGKFSIER